MDTEIERLADSASSFIGGWATLIPSGADEAARKPGEAEPENLSDKHRISQPGNCASARPSANPVHAAHTEFVAALVIHPPRPIPLDTDAIDLEDRADHLGWVFSALSAYVAVLLDDTAQNVPGGLDLCDAEGLLADLAADLTGAIQRSADSLAGWLA
jgi:hypothetical protein